MPPPIQTQSGSRTAIITYAVIASILFVVATVLAIFSSVAANKAEAQYNSTKSQFQNVVSETALQGDTVTSLTAARTALSLPNGTTLLDVAIAQRDNLARKILAGGSDATATAAAEKALANSQAATKTKSATLVAAVDNLSNSVKDKDKQIERLTGTNTDLGKKVAAISADAAKQAGAYKSDVDALKAQIADLTAANEAYRGEKDKSVGDLATASDEQSKTAQESIAKLNADLAEANGRAKKFDDQNKALQGKLLALRQPVDQIARQPDARVMRTAGDGIVYVDLGTGDGVSAGMSFEIYDRIQGIPKVGDSNNDENLPKGKASIEILRVSPGSSECRIVRQTPGETVVEGDSVVNIVFDKNIKYNFVVYGSFDLRRSGQTNPNDTDVVKRLITSWGGKVVPKLDANTDFVVIGRVPEVPNYSAEELERPEIKFQQEQKQKEVAEYDELLGQALQLNIPVLNQNRFLYFTGYFEQAAR